MSDHQTILHSFCAPLPRILESPGLYELRRGCNCWIWCCIGGSSQQGLQHAFDQFSAACDQVGTTVSSEKLRYCVSQDAQGSVFCTWAKTHCSRWRRSSTLGWYSWVTEVGTKGLIHGLVKLTQFCLLRELYFSVVTKRVFSKTPKLSAFTSVVVPILTCCHES